MATPLSVVPGPRADFDRDELLRGLEAICGATHVLAGAEALTPYARDETHGLKPMPPDAVAFPANTAEVKRIVQLCSRLGAPVTPRGAGSGRSGGCVAAQGGVVLAMTRMNAIRELHTGDSVALVEPGVILAHLQAAVEDAGLFYPPDPASAAYCTVGGTVAENAGGPRAVKYGVTKDYVLGMTVVLPTGEVVRLGRRTHKGVAGYELSSLMCGSEGTLAIITEITLRLVPRPRAVQTAIAVFPSSNSAAQAVTAVLCSGIAPRTLEYLDAATIDAVRPISPYHFPNGAGAALILETDGDDPEATLETLSRVAEVAQQHGASEVLVAQDEAQRQSIWTSRHLLSQATRRIKGQKVSEDVVVPRSQLPKMIERMAAIGARHSLMTCAFGHAGDGNLHVQILFDDAELHREAIEACMRDVTLAALELGGSVSGEHGVGLAKRALLPLEQGPDVIALQKRIKHAFDPARILNPGKIFI